MVAYRKIQVLPDHIANKIAAGEVIQRPESVVKELLENALDADARNILVVIEDGGKKLVQVTDDGLGMEEADAVTSFLRHATSKIASYEDLEAIRTYGFRGEALASIAAVAHVTMKTRRNEDDVAIVVQIDGGGEPRVSREGREPGTTVTVRNLFFNVPARRKFLKSTTTEFRHVYEVVHRAALSSPEIALQFISDGETIFDVKPGTLAERVLDIFGERQMDGMIPVEEPSEFLSLSGYIGKPTLGQRTRVNQFLFLNRRTIVNRNINHAVFSAYEHLLIKGTYPFFLLFIDIDPHRIDVNVHPSKMEAKFDDEQSIYRFVSTVVRKSLGMHDFVPAASLQSQGRGDEFIGLRFTGRQHSWPEGVDRSTGEIIPTEKGTAPFDHSAGGAPLGGRETAERLLGHIDGMFRGASSENAGGTEQAQEITREEAGFLPLVWQLHNKYILSPIPNGVMIVDQHVAHERILYERTLLRFERDLRASQQLLFPETVQLSPAEYALLSELLTYFEQLGFQLKLFGKNTVVIDAIPPDVKVGSESKIITELLALYREHSQHSPLDVRDNLAKSFSCKAAIKAGDPLGEQEMRSLIDQLFATKMPYVCPHGRPVVMKISIDELDRRFGRK